MPMEVGIWSVVTFFALEAREELEPWPERTLLPRP